jgi:PhoPQ-activated pathogenicity-related protein
VKAIMPIVIDTLNMPAQMKHQLESYGEYSDQIKDYTEKGIQQQMATDIGKRLNALVDPFHYRRLLTLPKLIINGTNDPYWTVDSLNLYWEDLEGPKYIFYAPNGGHDLNPEGVIRASTTAIAFAKMAAGRLTLPKLDWKLDEKDAGLGLTLESDLMPVAARVWWTTSPTRDFRRSKWEYVPMETKDDAFHHELPRPATGFAAAYAEGKYILDSKPAYFCTNIGVIAAKAPQK